MKRTARIRGNESAWSLGKEPRRDAWTRLVDACVRAKSTFVGWFTWCPMDSGDSLSTLWDAGRATRTHEQKVSKESAYAPPTRHQELYDSLAMPNGDTSSTLLAH